jgi:ATP-binding cassette subfamily A (ABC1) protein 3
LVVLLEESKEELGIEYYSVSPTTLDQVFLTVVGRHNVKEEGYEQEEKKRWWQFGK